MGTVEIPSERIKRALPAGSKVELTLELDRAGALQASARIPALGEVFAEVAQLVTPTTSAAGLEEAVTRMRQRSTELRGAAFRQGKAKLAAELGQLESRFAELGRDLEAARGGDPDALEKARRATSDVEAALDQIEKATDYPTVRHKETNVMRLQHS